MNVGLHRVGDHPHQHFFSLSLGSGIFVSLRWLAAAVEAVAGDYPGLPLLRWILPLRGPILQNGG